MQTIGHHTCKKDGGRYQVLSVAPFPSVYSETDDNQPFLGTGYYFWDDNLEMAKYWGKKHYNNHFYVVEADLNLPDEEFLDLVGNRQDMKYFLELIQTFEAEGYPRNEWQMCTFIEFLKKIQIEEPEYDGIFPFKILRAVDLNSHNDHKELFSFNVKTKSQIDLNPRLLICIISSPKIFLQNKRLAFESRN